MAAKTQKLTISIPVELGDRLKPFRDTANLSAVCTTALEVEADRLEAEARQRRYAEGSATAITDARGAPLLPTAEEIPEKYAALLSQMYEYEAQAWEKGYLDTAGTISVWKANPQ